MRKKHEMVELSFRIPADGWKDLTALLMALIGSVSPAVRQHMAESGMEQVLERGGGESTGFDEAVFKRLVQMEQTGKLTGEQAGKPEVEQAGKLAAEQTGEPAAEWAWKQAKEQAGELAKEPEGEQTGEQAAAAQQKAARQELMGQDLPPYRAEGWVSGPLSAPKPAAFTEMQALERQKDSGTDEESRGESKDGAEQIDWEQRWERDCRRYDGGFTLS